MAARRVLILMVVLLAVSTVMAGIVAQVEERRTTTDTEPAATAPEDDPRAIAPERPETVRAAIDAAQERAEPISGPLGGELELTVRSADRVEVEVAGLGTIVSAGPDEARSVTVPLFREGEFPILARPLEDGPQRVVGTVEVRAEE